MIKPDVTPFFHEPSSSWSYIVTAPGDNQCIVIDPVLDFDGPRARTGTAFADRLVAHIRERGLTLAWVLETHAHADRFSSAPHLVKALGGQIGIGANITRVQETWNGILNLSGPDAFSTDSFDRLLADGEELKVGPLTLRVMHTPGHTPADSTYVVGDAAFIGDTMFMSDYGSARVDFPDGDARALYRSIHRILELPRETRLFLCHDYLTETRKEHRSEISVADQRAQNIHVHDGIDEATFVAAREARDKTLSFPKLLLFAVPFNLHGGRPATAEPNGTSYIKMPLNRF